MGAKVAVGRLEAESVYETSGLTLRSPVPNDRYQLHQEQHARGRSQKNLQAFLQEFRDKLLNRPEKLGSLEPKRPIPMHWILNPEATACYHESERSSIPPRKLQTLKVGRIMAQYLKRLLLYILLASTESLKPCSPTPPSFEILINLRSPE